MDKPPATLWITDLSVRIFGLRPGGGNSPIAAWVEQAFTPTTIGGATIYDMTRPAS